MKQPSLQQFEVFLSVAEHNGFTAAAKHLGVTKAAVSHQVRLLEQSLKAPLFKRTTRRISLTDEGEQLAQQCRRLQRELDNARHLVSQFEAEPSGTLRISSNPYLANQWLLPILANYRQQFPKVDIDLRLEERMPDMEKESIDLVYAVNWPPPDDIIARPIGKTRYVLCASPAYLQQHGTPNTLKDLEQHQYLAHSGRRANNIIAQLKSPTALHLNIAMRINNANTLIQAAQDGLGITQLHDYMVETQLANGELVEVLSEYLKPSIDLFIYYNKHRYVQPKVRQLVSMIITT
ncbi:MAG: LysR family transcriptional regulator [Coxiellaceae bacterium]|nr:LysR family transcriptional regulator [Coxiellaceae bacterium]